MAAFIQRAIDLNVDGRHDEATKILESTVRKFPAHPAPWWYLGGIYRFELNRPLEALRCYRKAIEISPKSERASLGLFHTLWELDRVDEALEEIKRYQLLTEWSCKDYLEIVKELNEKLSEPPKAKNQPKRRGKP